MLTARSPERICEDDLKHVPALMPRGRADCRPIGEGMVFVVDDDPNVRESLCDLLAAKHWGVVTFASATEYLNYSRPDAAACLILDVGQSQVAGEDHPPIVFVTGGSDIGSCVRAFKLGAVDYLIKPLSAQTLIAAVEAAIAQDRMRRHEVAEILSLRIRLSSLTPREREVLALVVSGLLNKQSAAWLGIKEVTIQVHRSRVMEKMNAKSLADLVRMAAKLSVPWPTLGRR
jgi:FixJ family two-component response regulator